jgi:LPXTG-motif cell wall-anchored protein
MSDWIQAAAVILGLAIVAVGAWFLWGRKK